MGRPPDRLRGFRQRLGVVITMLRGILSRACGVGGRSGSIPHADRRPSDDEIQREADRILGRFHRTMAEESRKTKTETEIADLRRRVEALERKAATDGQ